MTPFYTIYLLILSYKIAKKASDFGKNVKIFGQSILK